MFEFFALAQECAPNVHPKTLAAIVQTESRFRPFSIGVNYGGPQLRRQPTTKAEAVQAAEGLIAKGYNIDMGLGQINSANLGWLKLTVEQVFDPCTNLAAAAKVLTGNYMRAIKSTGDPQRALGKALSAYNSGSFSRGYSNGYVGKVVKSHEHLVAVNYVVPAIAPTGRREQTPTAQMKPPPARAQLAQPAPRSGAPASTAAGEPLRVQGTRPRRSAEQVFATDLHEADDETSRVMVY